MNSRTLSCCIASIVFVLSYCGCNSSNNKESVNSDSNKYEDESYFNEVGHTSQESKNNSTMIGEFYLGMTPEEFNIAKSLFLKEHSSLAGIEIAKIQGYFYNNQLVRVIITSKEHLNWIGGDGENYTCTAWTDLYESKYNEFHGRDLFNSGLDASIFSKERCLIIVSDKDLINDLPTYWDYDLNFENIDSNSMLTKRLEKELEESKASLNRAPGIRYSEKRFSRIDIVDKNLYLNTLKERNKSSRQKKVDREKIEFELI